jgi:hypothetical protein
VFRFDFLIHTHRTLISDCCQSQSYFTIGGLPQISSSQRQAPWDSRHISFIFQLNTCGYSPYVTSSLTRGWVCRLQLLLGLASAVIVRSGSRMITFYCLRFEISPNLEGQVSIFMSLRNRVAQLYPQTLGSLFVASNYSQGYVGGTRPPPPHGRNYYWVRCGQIWTLSSNLTENTDDGCGCHSQYYSKH